MTMRSALCAVLLAAVSAPAQIQNGSFECPQIPGTALAAPWIEAGGFDSAAVRATDVPAGQTFGFPTAGAQFLRLSPLGTGPVLAGCGTLPVAGSGASNTAAWVTQTFTVPAAMALGFQWTFLLNEQPNNATYNDFFRADLWNPTTTPATHLATLVYVDSGFNAQGTGQCTITGVPVPVTYTGAAGTLEVNPPGPKTVSFNMAALPGIGPGSTVMLSFIVGNRGDDAGPSRAYVDNITPSIAAPGPIGQPNAATAALAINGAGAGTTCNGPHAATLAPGGILTIAVSGSANQPWALFFGPLNPANTTTPYGSVDIGTPGLYADVAIVLNGFAPLTLLDAMAVVPLGGTSTISFPIPPIFSSGTTLGTFQAIVGLDLSPYIRLTAAVSVSLL